MHRCRGYRGCAAVENISDVLGCELGFTGHDDLIALDGHNFTRILINEILIPGLQDVTGKFSSNGFLHVFLVHLHLLGQVEDLQDVLILLEADGTQQRRHRQLLLTVDVSIHDVVDVSGELYP